MSRIDELIAELCPDGVEYVTVEDICTKISSGGTPSTSRSDYYDGNIPWLRTQEVDWVDIVDTGIKITDEGLQNSSAKWIPQNCVIVAMYGATAAKVAINKIPLTTNQACCNLQVNEDKAIYRYVYYWLSDKYEELKKLGQGSQSNLNAMTVRKFYIPVPPLPVQDEIVRILDQFTSLEAELEAELEARKRQYEYYRDELISFDEDIKIFSLGDIAEISVGKKPDLILETITEYEYINAGTTNSGYTNDFNCEGDTITTPSRGQGGIGFVGYQKEPFWMGPLCYRIKAKDEQNLMTKYLYYYLHANNSRILALKKTGGVPAINRSDLVKLQIPVPEHEKQKRIVNILDNFDTLINNLVQGLPAEIEARQKQYEYYREKLLTFKEKVS